ncbi:unnamed protein product [Tuber aestivum]|uniref:BRCT domain-containing protein n=1 Tax=Tuber aestivum TaxID=59557 RepID=A0A292Q6H2_9PEZI|nr:unnamed protein product [Tuber aestivum]
MASSSSAAAATATTALHPWETEALTKTTWKFEGRLRKFTEAEAKALIISHGGHVLPPPIPLLQLPPRACLLTQTRRMAEENETPTHTLEAGSEGTYFAIYGGNKTGHIFEPGFILYIRSNAIGKRMNFAKPGCLEDLVFAVLGTLPWLTISEVGEIVRESGGALLRKGKRQKVPIEKPLDYIIVGEGADPADIEAARSLDIDVIDEQGLFDVVHDKDGMRTKKTGVTESRAEKFFKSLRERDEKEKEKENAGEGSGGGLSTDNSTGIQYPAPVGAPLPMADGGMNNPEDPPAPSMKRKESYPAVGIDSTNPPPQKRQEMSSARGANGPIVLE